MFDIGWSEMLVVGVVALIVVGPKDLPKMFHTLGEVTGKARGMAREFQRAMDVAARESGVSTVVKDFKRAASGQSIKEAAGLDGLEKDLRGIGTDHPVAPKAGTAKDPAMPPKSAASEPDETSADEAEARAHDAELTKRNAAESATEAERLKRAEKAAAARVKAAEARARREAAAATQPAVPSPEAES